MNTNKNNGSRAAVIWAILEDVARRQEETEQLLEKVARGQEETDRQMKETDRRLSKQFGDMGNRFGEVIEHNYPDHTKYDVCINTLCN